MYIFLTILSALFLGIHEVCKKVSLKKSSVYETLFFYCLIGSLLGLVFSKGQIFNVSLTNIAIIFLKSLVIVVNWLLLLICMKKLDVGIVVPFGLVNTVLTVFGSGIVFKERITWIHFASLLFIAIGIVLLSLLTHQEEKAKNNYRYILLLIFVNFLGMITSLLDKYLINYREVRWENLLFWFFFFTALIYGTIYLIKNRKIDLVQLKKNYVLIITGATIAMSDAFYYYAIACPNSEISMISIIKKSSIIVSTILAGFILKEKKILKKLAICFIMLIGVILPIFIH